MKSPELTGDAKKAVEHRSSHIQIIAAAGSGKTEVVSQRVASLLFEGTDPQSIVAFTFTERAAKELRQRIELRAVERIGKGTLDRIGGLFIGTIHSYCFHFLQRHVPKFETFDVLDENQLTAFLIREARHLTIHQLDPKGKERPFRAVPAFLKSLGVVENELLDPASMPEPFRSVLLAYYETLERHRLLTYGQQIVLAVKELQHPETAEAIHTSLRHLIVDEYQDVNPAQERLIKFLAGPMVELCVVGDDDQAIYQWRGADVSNIVTFINRYKGVVTFKITTNRRSRPQIIKAANEFATSIPNRLQKRMAMHRNAGGNEPAVIAWASEYENEEACSIAKMIRRLHDDGVPFCDIAVLVRSSTSYARLVDQFAQFDIPVQPGGRTGLFEQPDAELLGQTFCWLASIEWRENIWSPGTELELETILVGYVRLFHLKEQSRSRLQQHLLAWQGEVSGEGRTADLVGEFYELLTTLDVRSWCMDDPVKVNRLGTLARFSSLLVDYESVRRRARPDPAVEGEQVGGQNRGIWYYKNLALYIVHYANGEYEDFDGEQDFTQDAVDLLTIHKAKGLEWPVVFVPSLTTSRFPSSKVGQKVPWLVPRDRFVADRYEGSDADERRLFYVAMTRARDWLSLSRHERVTINSVSASPYWEEHRQFLANPERISFSEVVASKQSADEPIMISFSDLSSYIDCSKAYRLRTMIGFQPPIAPELGYGKSVHHVMRAIAERTQKTGAVPNADDLARIFDESFFLPAANKSVHRNLKNAARRLVDTYTAEHADDLLRTWETERPFELHLEGVTVTGRADVILDRENGGAESLAILDYKTSTDNNDSHDKLQVQVYANAGRREGLNIRGAYVHDLKSSSRDSISIDNRSLAKAELTITNATTRLRDNDFTPNPGDRCRSCDVRHICDSAME